MFFQSLVEWGSELAERRYRRLAGRIAVLVGTALFVAGAWLAWRLLPNGRFPPIPVVGRSDSLRSIRAYDVMAVLFNLNVNQNQSEYQC